MNRLSLVVLLVGSLALAIALNTNTTPSPAPQPHVAAATTTTHTSPVTQGVVAGQGHDEGQPQGYTCWTEHHAEDGGWDERLCRHDEAPAPAPSPYTCTSASSCAVLAAALNGSTQCGSDSDCASQDHARGTQPRAHTSRAPRASTAQHEDQPGWNCATQGNHVCGTGVAGGPLADDSCPAGGVRVYGTPHGCRYR